MQNPTLRDEAECTSPRLGLQEPVMELRTLTPTPKVPGLGDPKEPTGYKWKLEAE